VCSGEGLDESGLAGPVAADQADHLAGVEVDADAVDRVHAPERHADVAHLDERNPSDGFAFSSGFASHGHFGLRL
jgi:hypothetical protein